MVEILLVEDNEADVRLTREALNEAKITHHLSVVGDGEEALEFLFKRGKFAQAPKPDLIFLDFNLPKSDGLDVLKVIKADEHLRPIPVVVLTSSALPDDIHEAYQSNANAFITKPVDLDEFLAKIKELGDFWLRAVKLPPVDAPLTEDER